MSVAPIQAPWRVSSKLPNFLGRSDTVCAALTSCSVFFSYIPALPQAIRLPCQYRINLQSGDVLFSTLARDRLDGQVACKVFQDAKPALKAYTPRKQGS